MKHLVIVVLLFLSISLFGDEIKRIDDGFDAAFSEFTTAAKVGNFQVIAKYTSDQILSFYKDSFENIVAKDWRLKICVLHSAPRYSFRGGRVIFVEAVVEVEEFKKPRFLVMHWIRIGDSWYFLDFPFRDSGLLPTHAFDNYSMSEIADTAKRPNKLAQTTAITHPPSAKTPAPLSDL